MDTLEHHFEWITQLSTLLAIHTKNLFDLEKVQISYICYIAFNISSTLWFQFNSECSNMNQILDSYKKNLLNIMSNSNPKSFAENVTKAEALKNDLRNLKLQIQNLVTESKNLTPFKLRRQKLKKPYNKCKCLIPYHSSQVRQ